MLSLEVIRKDAKETYDLLKDCTTVKDLIALKEHGIDKESIQVSFNDIDEHFYGIDTVEAKNLAKKHNGEFEICKIYLIPETCLEWCTFYSHEYPKAVDFYFDAYVEEFDSGDGRCAIVDATLNPDTLTKLYYEMLEQDFEEER